VRRPFALTACERRAYQEAKALFKGAPVEKGTEGLKIAPVRAFKHRIIDSLRKQPQGPQL
jgi:hypothetical protein